MNRKSPETACFYAPTAPSSGGRETFRPLPTTASPWGPDSQHGGPPAALLGRALERLDAGVVGRFTIFDGRGLVARSNQALLVQRRPAQS